MTELLTLERVVRAVPAVAQHIAALCSEHDAAALRQSSRLLHAILQQSHHDWRLRIARHFGMSPDVSQAVCRAIDVHMALSCDDAGALPPHAQHALLARVLGLRVDGAGATG